MIMKLSLVCQWSQTCQWQWKLANSQYIMLYHRLQEETCLTLPMLHIHLFINFMHIVSNFINVILVIAVIIIQSYSSYSPLGVVRQLVSCSREWERMVDACEIKTTFCWKIHVKSMEYFAYSSLIIWYCTCSETDWNLFLLENLCFTGVKPLSAGSFYKYFLKDLALCVCVEKGCQRPELMRIPCTIFICGYKICGGQRGCGMGIALSTGVLCCHLLFY
jgi:hypothetical protein